MHENRGLNPYIQDVARRAAVAGFLALVSPFAAGLSITVVIGALLLAGGVAQMFVVFRAGSFGAGLLMAILAILTLVAGGYMLSQPLSALATLTLFLAGYFIAQGIVETIAAFGARPTPGWGIRMIMSGWTLIMVGGLANNVAKAADEVVD